MFQISLAAARVNAKLTQEEVAKNLGISKTTLCNWENGNTEPTISQLRRLGELYKISIDYICIPKRFN
jgi:transcriptional regulator with XRE-family HTH domain